MDEKPAESPDPESQPARICPKCGGSMREGYILGTVFKDEPRWIEGKPTRSFLTRFKTIGKEQYHLTTHRCDRCGFLESYGDKPSQ